MSDRTLDQQCTVTRPGVAAVASALLVEIFVSILQHPLRILAPAPERPAEDRGEHPLGIVPHQIRGFLMDFQNLVVRGKSYNCCSACSDKVVAAYKAEGWEFVKRALNERGYVEGISGLAEVGHRADQIYTMTDICRCNKLRKGQWPKWRLKRKKVSSPIKTANCINYRKSTLSYLNDTCLDL